MVRHGQIFNEEEQKPQFSVLAALIHSGVDLGSKDIARLNIPSDRRISQSKRVPQGSRAL